MAQGFALAAAVGGGLAAQPTWRAALPSPVLAWAARGAGDAAFSRTRVLGDRSTLHKYLNPNTLLLASAAARGRGDAPALEVLLLDTVSGRVLYRVRHAAASAPVHAVAADNAFVYAFWSAAAQRTEVCVLELYDEGAARAGGGLGALARGALLGGGGAGNSSSLAPPTLRIMGQSYSLGSALGALGVTRTRRGLAARAALLATRPGRVVALDRRFLDPRRPTRPTAAEREEGLIPYSEALPLLPAAHLGGGAAVARVARLLSAPAALESASHVAALGLDLFYARVAPAGTFDTLGGDFSRPLLAATVAALGAAAAAVAAAARRDSLARQWR